MILANLEYKTPGTQTKRGVIMKYFFLILISLFTQVSFAITCQVNEIFNSSSSQQSIELLSTDNPHGSVIPFKLNLYTNLDGFVALSNGFIVINLVDQTTGFAFSTQSQSQEKSFARLQLMMDISDAGTKAIVIECGEIQDNARANP